MFKSSKWLILLVVMICSGIGVYAVTSINDAFIQTESIKNQDYIIQTLNDSADKREQQFQQAKLEILNGISAKIDQDTHYLETIVKSMNITVFLENQTDSGSGKISGIGKGPVVVNISEIEK